MTDHPSTGAPAIVRVAIGVTSVFVVVEVAAGVAPKGNAGLVAVAWALGMFAVGSFLFLAAFFVAAGRSRDERLHMAGVVWLSGSAPPGVARALRSTVSVQCAVALVAAAVRPFSAVAFGILAPVFGLGCLAWYGARHGTFPAILTGQGAPVADGSARASEAPDAARVEPRRRGDESRDETADPDDFDQLFRRRKGMRR